MNYVAFKKSRPKTPINFYGYSRNLNKNQVKTSRRYDDNFDILEYLSENVKAELQVFFKIKNDSASNLKKLNPSKSRKLTTITLDLNSNGESKVALVTSTLAQNDKMSKKDKTTNIENHDGNFNTIQLIVAKLRKKLSAETDENLCDNYRNRIKNLNGYMDLITFCFKYLGKSGDDVKGVNSDFYHIATKDPIEVTIENSKMQYSIEDILTKYFRNISTVTQEISEVEVSLLFS
jgi:hypothetical protein